ncbi:MAG: hypothetical protein IIB95_02105 [Candidatus Marinimicrobia bacterium]|nr:hypothetical protein [Candidatus Neomarinimicrobiota bacterium]
MIRILDVKITETFNPSPSSLRHASGVLLFTELGLDLIHITIMEEILNEL